MDLVLFIGIELIFYGIRAAIYLIKCLFKIIVFIVQAIHNYIHRDDIFKELYHCQKG